VHVEKSSIMRRFDAARKSLSQIVLNNQGKIYSVRYEAVNAMLLKEHRKVQGLQKQVEKLTAGLQKVSDELELRKSAPQVVDNTR